MSWLLVAIRVGVLLLVIKQILSEEGEELDYSSPPTGKVARGAFHTLLAPGLKELWEDRTGVYSIYPGKMWPTEYEVQVTPWLTEAYWDWFRGLAK